MTDVRIYCSEDYKKQIKMLAVSKGITISELLLEIIIKSIPQEATNLQKEIENINNALAKNGSKMSANERQTLKKRRNEIKKIIREGENLWVR